MPWAPWFTAAPTFFIYAASVLAWSTAASISNVWISSDSVSSCFTGSPAPTRIALPPRVWAAWALTALTVAGLTSSLLPRVACQAVIHQMV